MKEIAEMLLSVILTSGTQAIFRSLGFLVLRPPASWDTDSDSLPAITYFVAAGSAAIACLWNVKSNGKKAMLIVFAGLLLIVSSSIFRYLSSTPPVHRYAAMTIAVGMGLLYLTYISYGFLVGRVVKTFSPGSRKP